MNTLFSLLLLALTFSSFSLLEEATLGSWNHCIATKDSRLICCGLTRWILSLSLRSQQHKPNYKLSKCTVFSDLQQRPERAFDVSTLFRRSMFTKATVHFYSHSLKMTFEEDCHSALIATQAELDAIEAHSPLKTEAGSKESPESIDSLWHSSRSQPGSRKATQQRSKREDCRLASERSV